MPAINYTDPITDAAINGFTDAITRYSESGGDPENVVDLKYVRNLLNCDDLLRAYNEARKLDSSVRAVIPDNAWLYMTAHYARDNFTD